MGTPVNTTQKVIQKVMLLWREVARQIAMPGTELRPTPDTCSPSSN
jgi:hypothetical protein